MNRSAIITGAIICLLISSPALAGEPGSSGFVFLRLGNGARAAGMGEAFTAVADDATGIYFNPAGLADIRGVSLNASHSEWLVDTRFEQASLAFEFMSGTVGFNFTGLYYGELERRRNYPTVLPDGTFTPYSLAASAGYGMDLLPDLSVGMSAKLIYEKIDFESATGFAIDIGAKHRSRIRGLSFAASILNVGPKAKFVEEEFYPPLQIRLGAAYQTSEEWLYGDLILSGDFLIQNDTDEKFLFGMEYTFRDILSVRGGYKGGYDSQGPTMGIGLLYNSIRFDYAYMPMDYDLGNAHRFSINVFPSSL
ncbi:MAG: PorV/PorQ family protein [Candidatus Latescibacteria bacterium]|nr:PorV/PorQ family protein [bacterium]MBD3424132.1 PorV/PorQ family protein [Candidatus Latescibacterota bacterium]